MSKETSVSHQRVNCGHMTSPKVIFHFWLITFDVSMIQSSKHNHCVSLVNTNRMICNTMQHIFDFFDHIIHHSKRHDGLNTMVVKSLTYLSGVQSYGSKQRCQFMKMVRWAETGRSRQPTYPYFFLLGFRPLYFEVQMKKKY